MTAGKLEHLLARQLSDKERRSRADFVINSGTGLKEMHSHLDQLIESLQNREGRIMERLRHSYTD
jgi:dephospho-CoA kinase